MDSKCHDTGPPHNGQNNVNEPPASATNEKVQNSPNHGVVPRRNIVATIWGIVQSILMAYAVFVALSNAIPKVFPDASCKFPVIAGYFPHCAREFKHDHTGKPAINPDFITLARLQSRLKSVTEDSALVPVAADNIKNSEIALRDLIKQVQTSSLVKKDLLGRELNRFVKDAQTAGESLQEFGNHAWGAVDRILSLDEHVLITLEGILLEDSGQYFGGIIKFLGPDRPDVAVARREGLEQLWLQAVDSLEKNIRRLIHEPQNNVGSLQRLETRLNNIQDMVVEEEDNLRGEERKHRKQWFPDKSEWRSNSAVLETVKNNRTEALKHVTGVLVKLKLMSNDLDDLRAGIVVPLITGPSNIPIEAYIRNIRNAAEHLVSGQTRAREIEVEHRHKKTRSDSPS